MRPHLFDPPARDYRPALDRIARETQARLTDHGTAQSFVLRGAPPATFTAVPLFEPDPEPERGPAPLPGQLTMTEDEPEPVPRSARPAPPQGAACRVPGYRLGPCTFHHEVVSPTTGARSWFVVDTRCNQFHAVRPERVRLTRTRSAI